MIDRNPFLIFLARLSIMIVASVGLYAILAIDVADDDGGAITVYAYSDMLSTDDFDEFTEETGIEVVVRHFECIEEVTTKLVFTHDNGIDIVAPTDAMVEVLRQKNLLRPLDPKKLPSISQLNPQLLGWFFDPQNIYTYPFSWSPVGVGYDTRVVRAAQDDIGWDIIWGKQEGDAIISPEQLYGPAVDKVCVGEDPFEMIFLALIHLYGKLDTDITPQQEEELVAYLSKQKQWVECYTNNLRYFLASGVCPAVVIPGAYMILSQEEYPWANFVVPAAGSIMYVGHLGIPATCRRVEKAHKVIEYMLSKKGALAAFENHAFIPANLLACEELPDRVKNHKHLYPRDIAASKIVTSHNGISLKKLEQIWHKVIV